MAEFDVRLTSDDKLILFHDSTYMGQKLSRTSFDEMNSLIAVTTLEELFVWFSEIDNFKLNLEIKSREYFNFKLEKAVLDLINKYNLADRILISSFNFFTLLKIRFFNPNIRRALLISFENFSFASFSKVFWIVSFLSKPHYLNLRYEDFDVHNNYFYKLARKIPIVLWTVNDLNFVKKYCLNIDGIISDSIKKDDLRGFHNAIQN